MAKISTLTLWRARLRDVARTPWGLLLLFAGDLVELGASIAFAVASPPPAGPRLPYAAFEVPTRPVQVTLGVAFLGVMLGLLMGAGLVAELWVMVRRAQILRWRYGTRREERLARRPLMAGMAR